MPRPREVDLDDLADDLVEQGDRMAMAGLDVDLEALDYLVGPLPEEPPDFRVGRIRIKERHSTANWDEKARCRGMDPNTFYPGRHSTPAEMREARDVCQKCPVRWDCLAYSLINWEKVGIWGGFTEIERRELRKMLKIVISEGAVPEDDAGAAAKWLERRLRSVTRSIRRGSAGREASDR